MNKQIVLILVGLICLTSIAYAGVSANYNLSWHVLSGGGGGQMDSATYALSSTVGQVSGYSGSSNYCMGAGYWYGAVSADTPQTIGTIKITSDPTGAMIEFDGERAVGPMSITPTTFTTSPGTHTIKLSQDGYQDWSTSVDVTAGGLSEVHGTLTPTAQIKFDTGTGTYPSISGTHNGTLTPTQTITVQKLYTYPCAGTGGHTEYARLWNATLDVNATWKGYQVDGHNITFDKPFTLVANETYNYTIRTGSYPQIIHATSKTVAGGTINCTSFVDTNGNEYDDWIPAILLGE